MKNPNDTFRLLRFLALGVGEGVVAGWILLLILVNPAPHPRQDEYVRP